MKRYVGEGVPIGLLGYSGGEPVTVHLRYEKEVLAHTTGEVAPDRIIFEVENVTAERGIMVVAVVPPGVDMAATPISFVPFLDGKRLITTQTFRDLFRSEVIAAREGISVKDITLLFTDLKESTALYDRIGDLSAFSLSARGRPCPC